MGLFSKESCCLCGKRVGILGRIKILEKKYLCKDCEKETSSFFDITRCTEDEIRSNIEYMKKQDILYKTEYETLSKEEKERHVCVDQGIVFADSIGMFEVLSGASKKRNYHELFRYDQVESYDKYQVVNTNTGNGGRKYSEVGVIIKLKCQRGIDAISKTETELKNSHPYVSEFRIRLETDTDSNLSFKDVINHFDKIFKKESSYKSFGESLKDDIIGTETERRKKKEAVKDIKDMASLISAKVKKDDEKFENAKGKLIDSMIDDMRESFGACDKKYIKLADEAEKRAWK